MSGTRVANARMYSVTPAAAQAWRELLAWVLADAGLASAACIPDDTRGWQVIEHLAPAPLPALWDRSDLGCVFMCGLPFSQRRPQPIALAAPVPSAARYDNQPRYASDLIVRADAASDPWRREGGPRLAYTELHSQSGCQALLHHLATTRPEVLRTARWVGPLVTPRRVVQAIVDGEADIGPLDSYAHELLRRHEPEWMAQVRTLASTAFTPLPLLIAAPGTPPETAERVRQALFRIEATPELAPQREALQLRRFAPVQAADYAVLAERARDTLPDPQPAPNDR